MRRTASLPLRALARPIPTFRSRPAFVSSRKHIRALAVSATELSFGQPLHETHPHLLQPGELTPGVPAIEYHHRRAALARKLPRNSVAVLAANEVKFRSGAVFYEFHQEPNFFYLTGFNEPDSVAVIEKGQTEADFTFHLFVRPKDPRAEQWDGARSGVQAAEDVFNADVAKDIRHISSTLSALIREAKEVYTDLGTSNHKTPIPRFLGGPETFPKLLQRSTLRPLQPIMNDLRATKSSAELTCMRRAGRISGEVLTAAMARHYTTEKQLWADLAYGYKTQGLDGEAYVPVIAGGTNALSIHYVRNDAELRAGELVLVDAGGEYGGYIADITRTWPVSGRFSAPQRDLYAMLLGVQERCLAMCREDADVSLDGLHRVAETELRAGLKDLGFETWRADCLDLLFPHHVGHYIGLDVHDAPGFARTQRLRANQCITIEPGVYVPPNDDRWPEHFRGLGIRIEDSVRIGEDAPEVLTSSAVKSVAEIEGLRG